MSVQKIIIFVLASLIFIIQQTNAKDEFFLMLKNKKVNVRYGPGFDYQVKYIYKKIQLPLKVIDKKENFRRIIDHKNNNGWIHVSQLRKAKSFIPLEDKIIFKKPSKFSKPLYITLKAMIASIKYAFAVIPKFVAKINVKQWAIVKAVINLKMSIYFVKKKRTPTRNNI